MVSFDEGGKLLWPAPVPIENQMFPLDQPGGAPVVVFTCQRAAAKQKKGRQPSLENRILCVDKRSGRVIYHAAEAKSVQNSWMDVVAQPDKKTVELRITTFSGAAVNEMANETVTLTFTDRPLGSADSPTGAKIGKKAVDKPSH